jgi:hypothetical protein
MKLSIQNNPVKAGTKRIVLHTGRRFSFEDFICHAVGSSTLTRADVLAVFNCAEQWIRQATAAGREADLGLLGRTRLGMKGSFTGEPQRLEDTDIEMTVNWILPPSIKRFAAVKGSDIIRKKTAPNDKNPAPGEARRILDNATEDPLANRYAPGKPLAIYGNRLNFDTTRDDEGVFLIAPEAGEQKIGQVISAMPKKIMCIVPAESSGSYRLQVRRRHKKGSGKVLAGELSRPLLPAE